MKAVTRRRSERGSALLIVFVFAAVLLIMLYREIPIATFEAQRQKEQLTIDRGHEYQRAVQLYYRKFRGQYPASIDALQSTNGMRFLRKKYTDPLTGKDDWRLLHAGAGGVIVDSKVNPIGTGTTANGSQAQTANGSGNQTAGFGQQSAASTSTTASSGLGSTSSDDTNGLNAGGAPPVRHPAPAIQANAGGVPQSNDPNAPQTPTSAELDADPTKPLLPITPSAGGSTGTQSGATGQSGTTTNAAGNAGQSAMNVVTQNNQLASGAQPQSVNGTTLGGGVAGVASIATGSSIKMVNDQTKYSLWEFYYDPSKDTGSGGSGTGTTNNQPTVPSAQSTQGLQQQQSNTSASVSGQSSTSTSSSPTTTTSTQ